MKKAVLTETYDGQTVFTCGDYGVVLDNREGMWKERPMSLWHLDEEMVLDFDDLYALLSEIKKLKQAK